MSVIVFRRCLIIISCFLCDFVGAQIHRYADTLIGVPAMASNQLPEVVVGLADHPHPRRISKLSLKYWLNKHRFKQESMPVIPVNPNHPAANAARKRAPSAAVLESPPRAAKTRADNALLHGASASAPRCHDVASVADASVATDTGNAACLADAHAITNAALAAAAGSIALPALSVNRSNSSDSDDSEMIGGDCANSPPLAEEYFQQMGIMMLTRRYAH